MIPGDYIETLAGAVQAIEEVEGRDAAYEFAMDSVERQKTSTSLLALLLGWLK